MSRDRGRGLGREEGPGSEGGDYRARSLCVVLCLVLWHPGLHQAAI